MRGYLHYGGRERVPPGVHGRLQPPLRPATPEPHDAHRPLRGDEDLYRIFTWQEERTLSQSLTVNYERVTYLIERSPQTIVLAKKRVVVHEWEDGRVEIHCQGRKLPYSVFDENPLVSQGAIVENKRIRDRRLEEGINTSTGDDLRY